MGEFDDFDDFDEFSEFGKFDSEKLNELFKERMANEEFRDRFFGIVGGYQRDFDRIMKLLYGMNNPFNDSYSGLSSSFNPDKNLFSNLPKTEDGWDTQHWESPDGSTSVTSFSRSMDWPLEVEDEFSVERLNLLENELSVALEEENYEEAIELRDSIKEIKEVLKDENEGNSENN